jgi:hypothetical protein
MNVTARNQTALRLPCKSASPDAAKERHSQPQVSTNIPINTISYTRGNDLSGSRQGAGGRASQALPVSSLNGKCRAARNGGLLARTDNSAFSIHTFTVMGTATSRRW